MSRECRGATTRAGLNAAGAERNRCRSGLVCRLLWRRPFVSTRRPQEPDQRLQDTGGPFSPPLRQSLGSARRAATPHRLASSQVSRGRDSFVSKPPPDGGPASGNSRPESRSVRLAPPRPRSPSGRDFCQPFRMQASPGLGRPHLLSRTGGSGGRLNAKKRCPLGARRPRHPLELDGRPKQSRRADTTPGAPRRPLSRAVLWLRREPHLALTGSQRPSPSRWRTASPVTHEPPLAALGRPILPASASPPYRTLLVVPRRPWRVLVRDPLRRRVTVNLFRFGLL